MSTTACSSCGVEVPTENITLHALRCSGQPPVLNSQNNGESTTASLAVSTSEVHTEADEPSEFGIQSMSEVRNGMPLEDVELEEQLPAPSLPAAPDADRTDSPTNGTWQCRRCTFQNSADSYACEMCMATAPFRQATGDVHAEVDRLNTITRSSIMSQSGNLQAKDMLAWLFSTALAGGVFGSLWGFWRFGDDGARIMNCTVLGMILGVLAGCVCGVHILCRYRHNQQQRYDLPLVDPSASRSRPLLFAEETPAQDPQRMNDFPFNESGARAPRLSRRALFSRQRMEEDMASNLVRQHQLLEEMLERFGNLMPEMEPANTRVITALPTHKVTAEEIQFAPPEHKACTICIEDFCEGDEQRTLPCFHRFHKDCVDQWLQRNGACPICKHRVDAGQA